MDSARTLDSYLVGASGLWVFLAHVVQPRIVQTFSFLAFASIFGYLCRNKYTYVDSCTISNKSLGQHILIQPLLV